MFSSTVPYGRNTDTRVPSLDLGSLEQRNRIQSVFNYLRNASREKEMAKANKELNGNAAAKPMFGGHCLFLANSCIYAWLLRSPDLPSSTLNRGPVWPCDKPYHGRYARITDALGRLLNQGFDATAPRALATRRQALLNPRLNRWGSRHPAFRLVPPCYPPHSTHPKASNDFPVQPRHLRSLPLKYLAHHPTS